MPTYVLGRDQVLTLNGSTLFGVREVDVDIETKTVDITAWNHRYGSTLPVSLDATIRLLIYGKDEWQSVRGIFDQHPPQPVTLGVTNGWSTDIRCLPVSAKITQPIAGVVAWEVTFRAYSYA